MEILVNFPGGARVDAHLGGFTIPTDQPPLASAPAPFELFLASIATCAGIYVLSFCQKRGISTEGIQIVQRAHSNPASGMIEQIDIEIVIPAAFPRKYLDPLVRAAELCKVKKHLEQPPVFNVITKVELTHQPNCVGIAER